MAKLKKCYKGFNCGFSCISKSLKCKSNVAENGAKLLETFSQYLTRQAKPAVPSILSELETLTKSWQKERGYEEPNYKAFDGSGYSKESIKGFFALHDASHPLTYLALGKTQQEIQSMYGAVPKPPGDKSPTIAEEAIVRAHELAALAQPSNIAGDMIMELIIDLASDTKDSQAKEWLKTLDVDAMYEQAQLMPAKIRDIMRNNLANRLYTYSEDDEMWVFNTPDELPQARSDYYSFDYKAENY